MVVRPNARAVRLVDSVWSRLDELERAGHDAGVLAALRSVLSAHQPDGRGRCRACGTGRRLRRGHWPCRTWFRVRVELLGTDIADHAARRPASHL